MPLKTYLFILLSSMASLGSAQQPQSTAESAPVKRSSSYCFFQSPKGWNISDPKLFSPRVQIGFFSRGKKEIGPSLNLAIEETHLPLSDYLKAVKAIHESDPASRWRQLGKIQTQAGLAQLTELDTKTELGPMRILQMILVKDGKAYILTAGAHKEEFAEYYQDFQKSFRSFQITVDLISSIPQADRRERLKQAQEGLFQKWSALCTDSMSAEALFSDSVFQKEAWLPFQNLVIQQFEDMGVFWQVQILRATQEHFADIPKMIQKSAFASPKKLIFESFSV